MNPLTMLALGNETPEVHVCSRAGCQASADWAILWRNPKIHSADRTKTWLSCTAHEAYLNDFLSARSFPLKVIPITELEHAS